MQRKKSPCPAVVDRVNFYVRELTMSYGESRKYELHEGLKALCDLIEAIDWTELSQSAKDSFREDLYKASQEFYSKGYEGASSRVLSAMSSIK